MKLLGKLDIFVFLIMVLLVLSFMDRNVAAERAEIYFKGKLERTIDLTKDAIYNVEDHMIVEVSDGRLRVLDSDCPDKLCVQEGWISTTGIPVVCVPNQVLIIIVEGAIKMDAISR